MNRTRALRIAVTLGLVAGVIFVSLGFIRPSVEIRTTHPVSRSPYVAFSVLTDPGQMPNWVGGFVSMEETLDREAEIGNTSVLRLESGADTLVLRQVVTAFDTGRHFQIEFEGHPVRGMVDVEMTPLPDGTEIMTTSRLEGTTWWMRSVLPFMTGEMRRTQQADYARLAAIIEAESPPLVGSWAGEDQWGNEQYFRFRPDGEVRWEAAAGEERFALDGVAWHLDRNTEPLQLDLTRFGAGPLEGMGLYGIIEFLSDDSLRVDLEAAPEGQSTVRPDSFTESSIVIRRVR